MTLRFICVLAFSALVFGREARHLSGSCSNKPGKLCGTVNGVFGGDTCCTGVAPVTSPWDCFATSAVQTDNADGSVTVDVYNCLIAGEPNTIDPVTGLATDVPTISYLYVSEGSCGDNRCPADKKQENVARDALIATLRIPAGACSVDACITVHDGRFRRDVPKDLPSACFSADNQRCMSCSYTITFKRADGAPCASAQAEVCGATCQNGVCTGGSTAQCPATGGSCIGDTGPSKGGCGLCVDNCGTGQGTNAGDVCEKYASYFQANSWQFTDGSCDQNDVNAGAAGGRLCPGTQVCCFPVTTVTDAGGKKTTVFVPLVSGACPVNS